jgi:hypothetical protein
MAPMSDIISSVCNLFFKINLVVLWLMPNKEILLLVEYLLHVMNLIAKSQTLSGSHCYTRNDRE